MPSNGLLAPPLHISTTLSQSDLSRSEPSESHNTCENGSSLQVPQPPSPRQSLGGDTLRSRAGSFNSFHTEDTVRSRANSNVSKLQSRFEGDNWTTEEALRPDKTNEQDFIVANSPFAYSPGQLNKTLNPKSLAAYKALGGLRGLEVGLQTDLVAGLSIDETTVAGKVTFEEATRAAKTSKTAGGQAVHHQDSSATGQEIKGQFQDRKKVYSDNRLPVKKSLSIWRLFWNAFNDRVLIILTIAAIVSLALGLYEALGQASEPEEGKSLDWVEGVAIEVAVVVVVLVTGLNDYRREKQFVILNAKKDDRQVKAIRSGKSILISVFDIMVGDVLHLESGDSIPADGILIEGHGVRCDESSATGESDAMRKFDGNEVWMRIEEGTATSKLDPFIISGSKVLEGVGTYLVTSVGINSSHGKIMAALQTENEDTPLQVKLARMANWIGYLGTAAAGLLFVILTIRFLAGLSTNPSSPALKGSQFLDILIVAITIIVVAVPEGLPVAVTLALSFATKQMLKENNLVRHLRACETMGNATTICSDKTGTLTQNKMTVIAGTMGSKVRFDKDVTAGEDLQENLSFPVAFERLSPTARTLLLQSCAINSTAFEGEENGISTFIGSKTETAILTMAKEQLGMGPVAEERSGVDFIQLFPFDSDRKCMGSVIRLASGTYRLLVKGAAEVLLAKATLEIADTAADTLQQCELSDSARTSVASNINEFAGKSLRTIAFLYKDFPEWPPKGAKTSHEDSSMAVFEDVFKQMTLLSVVGIQDPLRDGVHEAVQQCQHAGIKVRMVTGDNVMTARAIGSQCGIHTEGGLVMEGPQFRQLSDQEMDKIIPRLDILARSSPEDKRILVQHLKQLGETVAVTGDGTNDGPALKLADIGFSMGIAGTEVAKEASAIILMDDNFSSIVKAIMWGRSVNDAVAKFLQFQITVNITAVVLAFVSAVSSPDMHSVLSAVQLLWVNLIMDTFAALALATDAPTEKILNRKPVPKSAPLITTTMWKMIIGQAVYQLAVTFVLYFAGAAILGYDTSDPVLQTELNTIVFNTFVWMQIFNEFNNRRLDNGFNIFEGVHRNVFFIVINIIMVAGQIMIVFIGGRAFSIKRIDGVQWAICILCALPCMLWAVVLRFIPDRHAAAFFSFSGKVWDVLFKPVAKLGSLIFIPAAATWRALFNNFFSPLWRFSNGAWAKVFGVRKQTDNVEDVGMKKCSTDEEPSPTASSEGYPMSDTMTVGVTTPREESSPPEVMVLSPPPITLTAV